jgi:hypothetical protein
MKKRILILIASVILIFSTSFAKGNDGKVPENVVSEFTQNFTFASNVNWEMVAGYYKASFNVHDKTLFAFYTEDADFMGIAINVPSDKLPVSLLYKLKTHYSNYWITDLFKYEINNTPGYFVTMENADQIIRLKAEGNQGWQFYSAVRK